MAGCMGNLCNSICGGGGGGGARAERAKRQFTGKGCFIPSSTGMITSDYDLHKNLGEGAYGTVCKATRKSDRAVLAVKTIDKQREDEQKITNEIDIMKICDHPNIIKLYETFHDKKKIYMVMELCEGGELFDCIMDLVTFTEAQAAGVMKQIASPLFYLHSACVAHRDLKPENFLLQKKGKPDGLVKLIDFGLAKRFEKGVPLTTKAGTPYYVAPQVLDGKYDEACDMWSAGVIMYILLSGCPPFNGSDSEIFAAVRKGKFDYPDDSWRNVSADAKNLINSLIQLQPKRRFTAKQALDHVWIKDKAPNSKTVPLTTGTLGNMRNFKNQNKLKKASLKVIATYLSEDKIKGLREVFQSLDADGSGTLSVAELKQGMVKAGIQKPGDLDQILAGVDSDSSGMIDYSEFVAAAIDKQHYLAQDVCWSAFCVFDTDGDGKISTAELESVLQQQGVANALGGKQAHELMSMIDQDGDGHIDFDEFMKMMQAN